jgi:hypothetical protein
LLRCVGHLGMAEISLNGALSAPFSFRHHSKRAVFRRIKGSA